MPTRSAARVGTKAAVGLVIMTDFARYNRISRVAFEAEFSRANLPILVVDSASVQIASPMWHTAFFFPLPVPDQNQVDVAIGVVGAIAQGLAANAVWEAMKKAFGRLKPRRAKRWKIELTVQGRGDRRVTFEGEGLSPEEAVDALRAAYGAKRLTKKPTSQKLRRLKPRS